MNIGILHSFIICFWLRKDDRYIGLVSSYYLDENFEYTPWELIDQRKNALENNSIRGLGGEKSYASIW